MALYHAAMDDALISPEFGADYGDEFQSCSFKVDRADYHFQVLKDEILAWNQSNPYSLERKRNSNGSRHSLVISAINPPPVDRWSLLIGDLIHNLRSALDHLVYALAIRNDLKLEEIRNLQFPICDTPHGFKRQIGRNRLKGIAHAVRAQIECFQPYLRDRGKTERLLALLRDLDDIDKHRLLHVVLAQPYAYQVEDLSVPATILFDTYPIENGSEIVIITPVVPDIEFKYKFKGTINIAIAHGYTESGRPNLIPAIEVIYRLRKEVNFVIDAIVGVS